MMQKFCNLWWLLWPDFLVIVVSSSYMNCFSTKTESLAECVQSKFSSFTEKELFESKNDARKMFEFGYDNYMQHAYPQDELDPIHCSGRGHDYTDE